MTFRAVLFDLDGTLLDTLADLAGSMNAALAAMKLPVHPAEAYKQFVGDGIVMLARRALPPARRDDGAVAEAVERMRAEYANRWDATARPYEGIPELLGDLAARRVALAVLSNKPDDFTRRCVAKLLGDWQFAAVQGVTEEVPPKPDPRGAMRVAETLSLLPNEVLYLGDTATDMRTAGACGMFPVGALWGFRDADELTAGGAKKLIQRPADLLSLL